MYLVNHVKRGRGDTIYFPLIVAGAQDFATSADYTYAAGDAKISIDGATNANPTNALAYDADARMWALTLTDAETQGRLILITLVDSATKAVEDQAVVVSTDVTQGAIASDIATLASQTSFTIAEGSADDDAYNGWAALITDATTRTQQCLGIVSDYTGGTKTVTLLSDPGIFTMAAGDYIELIPGFLTGGLSTQAKADVNAEVVDTLNTDTYAEPGQGTPGATISLAAKINYLYKAWRNRSTQTASQYTLYNDDGTTVDQKATVSDDGTTADKGEVATGP